MITKFKKYNEAKAAKVPKFDEKAEYLKLIDSLEKDFQDTGHHYLKFIYVQGNNKRVYFDVSKLEIHELKEIFDVLEKKYKDYDIYFSSEGGDNSYPVLTFKILEKIASNDPIEIVKKINNNPNHIPVEYTLNDKGEVDVKGSIWLSDRKLKEIPVKFGKIEGSFYISNNYLRNLKNCPHTIAEDFRCSNNKLTTLVDGPKYVGGIYDVTRNHFPKDIQKQLQDEWGNALDGEEVLSKIPILFNQKLQGINSKSGVFD